MLEKTKTKNNILRFRFEILSIRHKSPVRYVRVNLHFDDVTS